MVKVLPLGLVTLLLGVSAFGKFRQQADPMNEMEFHAGSGVVKAVRNGEESGTITATGGKGARAYLVALKWKKFDGKRHKISYRGNENSSVGLFVDGQYAWGTDANSARPNQWPRWEISSFHVKIGSRSIPVPRRLWSDCFNPGEMAYEYVCKLNPQGSSLKIYMTGSDGAGGYGVIWTIGRQCHREIMDWESFYAKYGDQMLPSEPRAPGATSKQDTSKHRSPLRKGS